jgi:hypothetical protein
MLIFAFASIYTADSLFHHAAFSFFLACYTDLNHLPKPLFKPLTLVKLDSLPFPEHGIKSIFTKSMLQGRDCVMCPRCIEALQGD